MKRGVCVIMALFFLVGLISVSAFAQVTVSTTDLLAGKTMDVGEVQVWNDGENLYVKYVLDPDWCLTEYHLHVATLLDEIPQTKKGNPKPGHFEYKEEYDACLVDPVLIEIPLNEVNGESLAIAAHAVVYAFETEWQIGDEEVNVCDGDMTNYANEFNWKKEDSPDDFSLTVGDCELGPGLGLNEPAFASPFFVGVTPTDEFPYNSNSDRGYATDFDIEWNGELPLGGRLTISWSPGASGQETKVVSGDGIDETTFSAVGQNQGGQGWFWNKYPLVVDSVSVNPLPYATHSITFEQTRGNGTFWDWVRLEKPGDHESAWAAGDEFNEGKNWATYFNYTVEEEDSQ
jgi:hypothetical protein